MQLKLLYQSIPLRNKEEAKQQQRRSKEATKKQQRRSKSQ
jgi:hypothetical protein